MLVFRVLKNKYFISAVALTVWLFFFDKNDIFTQYQLVEKCRKLEHEKAWYLEQIATHRQTLHALRTDKKFLERFAREKYLMKRDDEDVFVFVAR